MPRGSSQFEASQPDKRRFARWRDQHGRTWEGVTDINNGYPIGPLSLVGINPPFVPDQKYFIYPALADGTFEIDYKRMIQDREQAKRVYENRRIKYAQRMYGEQAGKMLKQNPVELQRSVGIEPEPTEPVLAASAGNKWVLGLSDQKPAWAEAYNWGPRSYTGVDMEDDPSEWSGDRLATLFPDADQEVVANTEE